MIAYFIALQAATMPVANAPEEDVMVIAERAGTVKFKGGIKDGQFFCDVTQSSGDAEVDAILCASFKACAPKMQAAVEAIEEKALTGRQRRAAMREAEQAYGQCSEREHEAGVQRLADARWDARNAQEGEAE